MESESVIYADRSRTRP